MGAIDNLMHENRTFAPPATWSPSKTFHPNVTTEFVTSAAADRDAFWAAQSERITWATPWHTLYEWAPVTQTGELADGTPELSVPAAQWFVGGTLNVAFNCVDRHVLAGRGEKVALYFEGEPGDRRAITYQQLQDEVSQAANALTALGIEKGDRVVIYLPVIPETIIITLAVARIGAIHSLVFGGFSAEALKFRVEDTRAKLLVTTDGQYRRGHAVPVKANADAAVSEAPDLEHVLVVKRTNSDINWVPGRDVWWHETVGTAPTTHTPEAFDAETPLFIIYTSGTTGKPKGLVHTSGGYLTHATYAHWAHFDAKDTDVHWCTADLAWVTAHTFEIYGPLSNGLTQVIYEGTPNTPHESRHFEIIERYGVTVYYTAPTLIRTFMTWGNHILDGHDLSSIRLLGTVGEAINPEAWVWFHENIGGGRCPIIDTWWQSETGATILAPLPALTTLKPGSATRPLPGLSAIVVDEDGKEVAHGEGGYLAIDKPWPGMARTVWGNPERYRDSYWAKFWQNGLYFAGDGAKYDADGYIWLLGRVDDVINVSGHRLSTIEVESALVSHAAVGESGVVGVPDDRTGDAIAAFVIPTDKTILDADPATQAALKADLLQHVSREIGPIAKPRDLHFVPDLPKTRSGKIMRRLLGDVAAGKTLGDTTSLQDETVLPRIAALLASAGASAVNNSTKGP